MDNIDNGDQVKKIEETEKKGFFGRLLAKKETKAKNENDKIEEEKNDEEKINQDSEIPKEYKKIKLNLQDDNEDEV